MTELQIDQSEDLLPTEILTADLISELYLGSMRLTILAACATDVGERTDGEGAIALTQALHIAAIPRSNLGRVITDFRKFFDDAIMGIADARANRQGRDASD